MGAELSPLVFVSVPRGICGSESEIARSWNEEKVRWATTMASWCAPGWQSASGVGRCYPESASNAESKLLGEQTQIGPSPIAEVYSQAGARFVSDKNHVLEVDRILRLELTS